TPSGGTRSGAVPPVRSYADRRVGTRSYRRSGRTDGVCAAAVPPWTDWGEQRYRTFHSVCEGLIDHRVANDVSTIPPARHEGVTPHVTSDGLALIRPAETCKPGVRFDRLSRNGGRGCLTVAAWD